MQIVLGIVGILLLAAACVLLMLVLVVALQVFMACGARHREGEDAAESASFVRPTVAVLMPAHDEAEGIAASITCVRSQLGAQDRLLVVADNCSDRTAGVAKEAGAEVIERRDAERRGKGFALDWGVRHLGSAPPEIVVVVDADCIVSDGTIEALARRCASRGRPVQALYLMRSPAAPPLKTRIAEFAWVVRNEVRALGFYRLGLPCQLMGTGMAFPWELIRHAPLASAHIVEDLQLGLELAAAGAPPILCPEALVTSVFPLAGTGLDSQRTRWEHGHLSVIATMAPRLLWQAAKRGQGVLAMMVLDLCVPPLAALAVALSVTLMAAAGVAAAGGPNVALRIASLSFFLFFVAVVSAWYGFGRHIVTLRELATAPAYVFGKIPLYARWVWRRQTAWVRTHRDDGRP